MNAIILAAGLGSRFKDITQSTHKALLDIHG
ncbi:TPA: CTP--phosphocholine cytidylyltransferase, partial [Haemophilus influenzae]